MRFSMGDGTRIKAEGLEWFQDVEFPDRPLKTFSVPIDTDLDTLKLEEDAV